MVILLLAAIFFGKRNLCRICLGARGDRGGVSLGGEVVSGRAAKDRLVTLSRHSNGPSTNGRVRPLTAVHWSHSQGLLTDEKAAVRTTLCKRPVLIPVIRASCGAPQQALD